MIRIYKVKYEFVMELSSEEADEICDFIGDHFFIDPQSSHYYIGGFKEDLDDEDVEKNRKIVALS